MASELEGVAELTAKLSQLGKKVQGKALRIAVREAMKPALKRAEALIPVGKVAHKTYRGRLVAPGFAKRNIRIRTRLSRDKEKATAILGVNREAFYAVQFVELGTSKMAAQPWLRPAFESTRSQQQSALAAALKKQIDKAARSR